MKIGFIGVGTMGAFMASNLSVGGACADRQRRAEGRGGAAPRRRRHLGGHAP